MNNEKLQRGNRPNPMECPCFSSRFRRPSQKKAGKWRNSLVLQGLPFGFALPVTFLQHSDDTNLFTVVLSLMSVQSRT